MLKFHRLAVFASIIFGLYSAVVPQSSYADDAHQSRYAVTEVEAKDIPVPAIILPDITGYTLDNLRKKVPALKEGKVSVVPMAQIFGLWKFSDSKFLPRFAAFQQAKVPQAILVESGVHDLDGLVEAVKNPAYFEKSGDDYILKLPIYVEHGATLVARGVEGSVSRHLKMSVADGAFLANGGDVFATDLTISGWDVKAQTFAGYKDKNAFRPFYTAWSGSHSYLGNVSFHSMGSGDTKAYGVALSSDTRIAQREHNVPRPDGWIVGCQFEDMYYAFYTYEAENVAVINNVFRNNIIYGIDPHDRSRHLIIAGNEAYGTLKKHGIIVSREVNDSWIFNNKSHNNHGSGIMLDRNSRNNIVANNSSYDNEAFGLALFESPQNIIANNQLINNKKDGLTVRNSWDIQAIGNTVNANKLTGINVSAKSIDDNEGRDFKEDPYSIRAGLNLIGGTIGQNGKGGLSYDRIEALRLSNVTFVKPSNDSIVGNTSLSGQRDLLRLLQEGKSFTILPEAGDKTAQK